MRNLIIVGAAAASLAALAIGCAEAANPNVSQSSPYTLMDVDSSTSYPGGQIATEIVEGRSAYVEGDLRATPSHHRMVTGGDDIVVRTPRSYLDPGPSAEIGTEDRYFYDTAHYSLNSEGPAFTQNRGGFENLPGQFGPN